MNNKIKMALDVIMTILFISLMKISFTGIVLHKIIGLGIFVLFITHTLLNYKWAISMYNNIFTGKIKGKAKFIFVLNTTLLFLTGFTVISGILISPSNTTTVWSELHHFAAYSSLILISIHIGLHWNMIINFFRKAFRMNTENGTKTWLARGIALALALFGVKALFNQNIQSNFTAPFVSERQNVALYADTKNSVQDQSSITNSLVVENPTLEEYLSKLYCSACPRRCPLTSLRCGKGNAYKERAIAEYKEKYPQSNTSSTGSDSKATTAVDFIGIMSLVIAGTHYTITIPKKLK